jgi:hypothetical protein
VLQKPKAGELREMSETFTTESTRTFSVSVAARRILSMLAILVAVSSFAAPARANVTNDYNGYNCWPAITADPDIYYDWQTGGIKNVGSDPKDIICEIRKYTSYPATPANTTDKITSVHVDINNWPQTTGVSCTVQVYSSYLPSTGSNITSDVQAHQSSESDYDITLSGFTTTNWWGSDSSWKYAMMDCLLQPGQEVNDYSVTEEGTDNHHHIYSALSLCSPADSTSRTANIEFSTDTTLGPSGDIAAPGGSDQFFYACYLPGDEAQFSITPSDNNTEGWQWSYSYYGSDYGSPCNNNGIGTLCAYPGTCWSDSISCIEPGSYYTAGNLPSKIFPGTSTDLPAPYNSSTHFLDSTTYYYAYFRQIVGSGGYANGDMKFVSVRTSGDYY